MNYLYDNKVICPSAKMTWLPAFSHECYLACHMKWVRRTRCILFLHSIISLYVMICMHFRYCGLLTVYRNLPPPPHQHSFRPLCHSHPIPETVTKKGPKSWEGSFYTLLAMRSFAITEIIILDHCRGKWWLPVGAASFIFKMPSEMKLYWGITGQNGSLQKKHCCHQHKPPYEWRSPLI